MRYEDLGPAVIYVGITWLLHALSMSNDALWGFNTFGGWWPVLLGVGCLAIILRRWHAPACAAVMAFTGIVLLLIGSTGGFFLIFECIFTLVLLGGQRTSKVTEHGALVLTLLLAVGMYFVTGSAGISVTLGLAATLTLVMPAQWAGNVRHARELASSEAQTAAAVTEAAAARAAAQDAEHERLMSLERSVMAREVHDVLSARLSAIALQSGAALNAPQNTALNDRAMEQIRAQSVQGIEELRTMIRLLHDGVPLEPAGTLADVPALIQTYSGTGLNITYNNRLAPRDVVPHALVQATLYLSINEVLINFSKHAPDGELTMELARLEDSVHFTASNTVRNTSDASRTMQGTGTGLRSMSARTTEMGGIFRSATENDRFTLSVQLPIRGGLPADASGSVAENSNGFPLPRRKAPR